MANNSSGFWGKRVNINRWLSFPLWKSGLLLTWGEDKEGHWMEKICISEKDSAFPEFEKYIIWGWCCCFLVPSGSKWIAASWLTNIIFYSFPQSHALNLHVFLELNNALHKSAPGSVAVVHVSPQDMCHDIVLMVLISCWHLQHATLLPLLI